MEPRVAAKKTLLVWRYHQLLCGFLAKGHVPRVSRKSRRSLMIRVIMKWSWSCAQISWHLPYSWGKPQKTSTRRPTMKALQSIIASNGVPSLQMRSVGSHYWLLSKKQCVRLGTNICYILTFFLFFCLQNLFCSPYVD